MKATLLLSLFSVVIAMLPACGDSCNVDDALITSTMLCLDPLVFSEELEAARAGGGIAVVATRASFPVATQPTLSPDESGLFLAHERSVATYMVVDPLGESVGSEVQVVAWTGQRYAARANGSPVCADPPVVRLRCDLETSIHEFGPFTDVLILLPEGDQWFLRHRARVVEDRVHVYAGDTIPLDSLRR